MSITLQHDGPIDIAHAKTRKATSWRNQEYTWAKLVNKLSNTHRSAETVADYARAKKERQDEIKDIGGFVAGYLAGGKRKTAAVMYRTVVTLDLDFAKADTWDNFTLVYPYAACVYSTHKHTPERPRLRLLLPIDRHVDREEYMAISRRVAQWIGIEQTDHTTFEPARLMYWPSTPIDGEYIFAYQDGPWLSADQVLATYRNWRDASEWPTAPGESEAVNRDLKKQGDPMDKPGIVGAFCRTYDIHQAIAKYLPDVYTPTDMDGRYTYAEGTTSGGLVVYDDKFAYSHHGTDPASGKLCNAFDLVRLHLYGLQDEAAAADTPINRLPSYTAMSELATRDGDVRATIAQERLSEAMVDFTGTLTMPTDTRPQGSAPQGRQLTGQLPPPPDGDDWTRQLDTDKTGKFRPTYANIMLIMRNDDNLRGRFSRNEFTQRDTVDRPLPWRQDIIDRPYVGDIDLINLRMYLESVYGITNAGKVAESLTAVCDENRYHPVREYLQGLTWDSQQRVDTLLIDYMGAEDTPYTRTVTRKAMAAAVARVFIPGIKFDYVLTLTGHQGAGKSSLIRKLGGQWYCENLTTVQGKEAAEQLHGVWLMEMGELAGLKKAEVEIIKNFISRTEDSYRPAYGVKKETYPRQCIFIGTTNNDDFLRDPTGNRRFWPVPIGVEEPAYNVHSDLTEAVRGQIWAEAVAIWQAGETLYLDSGMEAVARKAQEEHTEIDGRLPILEKYLEMALPSDWETMDIEQRRNYFKGDPLAANGSVERTRVSTIEIWVEALGGLPREFDSGRARLISNMMRHFPGWIKSVNRLHDPIYGKVRVYLKSDSLDVKLGIKTDGDVPF